MTKRRMRRMFAAMAGGAAGRQGKREDLEMAKTLVIPAHIVGPKLNGFDGCFARAGNDGICPGLETANWLNALGEDEELFGGLKRTTNGMIRDNWLRGIDHIVAQDRRLADLRERERVLVIELKTIREKLAEAEQGGR